MKSVPSEAKEKARDAKGLAARKKEDGYCLMFTLDQANREAAERFKNKETGNSALRL